MFYQFKSYLSFLRQSNTKYGVHSPFVFDLITKCFNAKNNINKSTTFKQYKQFLIKNNKQIKVSDFGAGSHVLKSDKRAISDIAKNAGISPKRATLLMRIVAYFKVSAILEIGTSLGISTLALALGNEKSNIITLEGCPETVKIPKKKLQEYVKTEIKFIVGEFSKTLPKVIKNQQFDIVFFDGNHQKEPTIQYFEQCLQTVHNESVFIFDDIHWSKEMTEAWQHIKNHKKVTLTIDTFYWGMVFFRKEQQEKEHFVIRVYERGEKREARNKRQEIRRKTKKY